jgi:hypothetical protein
MADGVEKRRKGEEGQGDETKRSKTASYSASRLGECKEVIVELGGGMEVESWGKSNLDPSALIGLLATGWRWDSRIPIPG